MKKLLLSVMVITGLFAFTGCMTPAEQEQTVEESFITAEEITEYKDIIEDTFNSFYWYYDDESVEFAEKKVPYASKEEFFKAKDALDFEGEGVHYNEDGTITLNV